MINLLPWFCHMPKINGNEIRPGNVLEHNDGLWAAVKVDHVKPGKGGAFAQVEMRNLRNGSKLNDRFRSADKVERVRLEQKDLRTDQPAGGIAWRPPSVPARRHDHRGGIL